MEHNNEWIIYEIPNHKVGMCKLDQYPRRPLSQIKSLFNLNSRAEGVEGTHFRTLKLLQNITKKEALDAECEYQDALGYAVDKDISLGVYPLSSKTEEEKDTIYSKVSKKLKNKPRPKELMELIHSKQRGVPREHTKGKHNGNFSGLYYGKCRTTGNEIGPFEALSEIDEFFNNTNGNSRNIPSVLSGKRTNCFNHYWTREER